MLTFRSIGNRKLGRFQLPIEIGKGINGLSLH